MQNTDQPVAYGLRETNGVPGRDVIVYLTNTLLGGCINSRRDLVSILPDGIGNGTVERGLLRIRELLCTAEGNLLADRIKNLGYLAWRNLGGAQRNAVIVNGSAGQIGHLLRRATEK